MKMPGEQTVQILFYAIVLALIVFFLLAIRASGKKEVTFDAVKGKLETTEDSAEISRKADDRAGSILQGINNEARKDRAAVVAARRPGATASDRERLHQRAREAYAAGLCAEKRLQRENCGPGVPAAAGN